MERSGCLGMGVCLEGKVLRRALFWNLHSKPVLIPKSKIGDPWILTVVFGLFWGRIWRGKNFRKIGATRLENGFFAYFMHLFYSQFEISISPLPDMLEPPMFF